MDVSLLLNDNYEVLLCADSLVLARDRREPCLLALFEPILIESEYLITLRMVKDERVPKFFNDHIKEIVQL